MNRTTRALRGLVAVAAATAVGVTTHDAGFTVITFVGALALPRILGLTGRGKRLWAAGCVGRRGGRSHVEERLASWHRGAHAEVGPGTPGAAESAPTTV